MDRYINELAKLLIKDTENEGSNWKTIKYNLCVVSTYYHEELEFITSEGNIESLYPSNEDEIFPLLRQAMYEKDSSKGAWYSMTMEIHKDGKFKVDFNYDDKPNFGIEIDEERYFVDFQAYPREEQYIPQWLKDIIKKHQK